MCLIFFMCTLYKNSSAPPRTHESTPCFCPSCHRNSLFLSVLPKKRPVFVRLPWKPFFSFSFLSFFFSSISLSVQHCNSCLPPYLSSSLCIYEQSAKNSKAKSQIIWTTFFQFHGTISLEFSAGHSKKCTNTASIQIAAKNRLVCPGLPVESEERCVCVWQLNVDGCIWIGSGGRERAWQI